MSKYSKKEMMTIDVPVEWAEFQLTKGGIIPHSQEIKDICREGLAARKSQYDKWRDEIKAAESPDRTYCQLRDLNISISDMPDYPFFGEWTFDYSPPERWDELVGTLCKLIAFRIEHSSVDSSSLKVLQAKDKFGGLRFYYLLSDPRESSESGREEHASLAGYIRGLVDMAESVSFSIK